MIDTVSKLISSVTKTFSGKDFKIVNVTSDGTVYGYDEDEESYWKISLKIEEVLEDEIPVNISKEG